MKTLRFEFILRAEQPICHLEESLGNSGLAMRRKVILPDGRATRIPCITADTMRHGLRDAVTYSYLDAAGLLGQDLGEEALRLLFAGGMITGSAGGSVKMADYWQMVELNPALALLGGNAQNRSIPGRLFVDDSTLICEEQMHVLPDWVREWLKESGVGVASHRAYIEEAQRVRMDPLLDPAKRALLLPDHRARAEQRLIASETAATDNDAGATEQAKSTMMPRRFERLVQGALFWWGVTAHILSDLDDDTFKVMVASFLYDAHVGGKRGTGHGLLRAVRGWNIDVRRPAERTESLDVRELGGQIGAIFRAHVSERRDQIAEFLKRVAA